MAEFRSVSRGRGGSVVLESIKAGTRVKIVVGFGHEGSRGSIKVLARTGDGVPVLARLVETSALAVSAWHWSEKVFNEDRGVVEGEGFVTDGDSGLDLNAVVGIIEDDAVLGALGEALALDEADLFLMAEALLSA